MLGSVGGEVPGQQFGDAVDRVIGDAREHVAQVGFGIEAVELGRADQAVDRGGALAAGIGAAKQVVLATQSYSAQGPLGCVMPRPGLCRVGPQSIRKHGVARAFEAA